MPTGNEEPIETQPVIIETQPIVPPTTQDTVIEEENVVEQEEEPQIKINKYIGMYADHPNQLGDLRSSINVLGWFDSFDKTSSAKLEICLDKDEYVAFITLEPDGMSLDDIVNGVHDKKIIAYLSELSKGDRVNKELFVRFAHEMEMRKSYGSPWYPWQSYDSDAYIAAWKHIVDLGRIHSPNVKWVWSPNRVDELTKAYYPGDEYVDYVGLTLNANAGYDQSFGDFYEEVGQKDWLEDYGKPIIFSEVAKHRVSQNTQNEYIADALEYIQSDERYAGIIFFNENISSDRKYQFSHDPLIVSTFVEKAKELLYIEEA